MDVWMYGYIDVWMYGCMDVWIYVWMYVVCVLSYKAGQEHHRSSPPH
jgi:hypothetical protein